MAKLVEVLARELREWPLFTKYITQDSTGRFNQYGSIKPSVVTGEDEHRVIWTDRDFVGFLEIDEACLADDFAVSIVTRAMWQSERDRQTGGEWKRNRGKTHKSPVGNNDMVEVRFRDGSTEIDKGYPRWYHAGDRRDIMAFRVLEKPEQEEKEVVQEIKFPAGTKVEYAFAPKGEVPEDKDWITFGFITEPKTEYFDGPLKWRDGVSELEAYIEEFTRERDDLVKRLESEGFSLIPHNTPVQGFIDQVDMQDWRNWKAGDIVQCVTTPDSHGGYYTKCSEYSIAEVDLSDDMYPVDVTCDSGFSLWCPSHSFKFIRHP